MDLAHCHPLEPHRGHLLKSPTASPLSPQRAGLPEETRALIASLIGQPPADDSLWIEAITHGSMGVTPDYQRLGFLGDRVLGLVIADWLFETPGDAEGRLSQRLNALVSRAMCARIARGLGLGPHIRLGKQARDDGGADSDNILGDVMEALIGASFIAYGFEPTRAMVRRLWAEAVGGKAGQAKHPKSPRNTGWSTAAGQIMPSASPLPCRSIASARRKPPAPANKRPKPRPPQNF